MIGSSTQCVVGSGAIDPRHDDGNGNGDGNYCGPNVPGSTGQTSWAMRMQTDCYTERASRDDFLPFEPGPVGADRRSKSSAAHPRRGGFEPHTDPSVGAGPTESRSLP